MPSNPSQPATAVPFPRGSLLMAVLASLAVFTLVLSGHGSSLLQRLEHGYADLRTSLLSDKISADHNDITIISVGENVSSTRATFGQRVDIDRGQLAALIEALDGAAPRAIGIDIPLSDAGDPLKDQALQRILREAKTRVVIGVRGRPNDALVERRGWTDRFITGTGRPAGHISTIYEGDRAVSYESSAQTTASVPDSFALLMARALRPEVQRDIGPIAWLQKVDPGGIFSRFLNIGAQQPFRIIYSNELTDTTKPLPTRQLAGRLVIVTTGLAEIERHRTPLTFWTGELQPPVLVQAQAVAQLLDGRNVDELRPHSTRLALFALACIAAFVGWNRRPGWGIGGVLLALFVMIAVDVVVFSWSGATLPMVIGVLIWLLGETAGRGVRNILRWEERYGLPWPVPVQTKDAVGRVERERVEHNDQRPLPLA